MTWIRSFAAFWYDFIVGDDWRVALGVILALGATTGLLHGAGVNAWWLLPIVVIALLGLSLRRVVASARQR
jgi:hypothetical protein